jgi:hypothetical protein
VAYRAHAANSVRNVEAIVNGIFKIIETERSGEFPGGHERMLERYACIGGIAGLWMKYAWRAGQHNLALKLLRASALMIAAAGYRKTLGVFRKPRITSISGEVNAGSK